MSLPIPLDKCSKIFMLHMNFKSRAREHGDWPAHPIYYLKPPSTLTSGGVPIVMPPGVTTMLGEAEIAVVIGREARNVLEAEALKYVSHFAASNDVTVFDYGWSDAPSLTRSKGFDSFTPMGELLPAGSVDPEDLLLRLWVNGELRQEAHSSDMIFPFARLVAELSAIMTLNPGDVILTGTPAGAPLLAVGDDVVVELAGTSRTANTVVADRRSQSALLPSPRVTPRGRAVSIGAACHRLSKATAGQLARFVAAGIETVRQKAASMDVAVCPIELTASNQTFVGHAFTLRQVPARNADSAAWPHAAKAAFETLRAVGIGEVIVAEGQFSEQHQAALIERLSEKSAAAVVSEVAPSLHSRFLPVAINTPVVINGVTVMPGDILMSVNGQSLLVPGEAVDRLLEVIP